MQPHWKGVGHYTTVGLELALSVLFGLWVGTWLDGKLGTRWISLVGFGFGVAAGARTVWRALQRANREAERAEQEEQREREKYLDDDRRS